MKLSPVWIAGLLVALPAAAVSVPYPNLNVQCPSCDSTGLALGDFNADGNLDIAGSGEGVGVVCVFLGNGDGSFAPVESYPVDGVGGPLRTADPDGDGALDLVVSHWLLELGGIGGFSVLLGNGDGSFGPPTVFDAGASQAFGIADFDQDGTPDVLMGTGTSGCFGGSATGVFSHPSRWARCRPT